MDPSCRGAISRRAKSNNITVLVMVIEATARRIEAQRSRSMARRGACRVESRPLLCTQSRPASWVNMASSRVLFFCTFRPKGKKSASPQGSCLKRSTSRRYLAHCSRSHRADRLDVGYTMWRALSGSRHRRGESRLKHLHIPRVQARLLHSALNGPVHAT